MLVIQADHRSIRTRPEPEVHDRIVRRLDAWVRSELRFARDFARLEHSSTWAEWGCASVVEYGTRHGYRAAQVRHWAALGKALEAVPVLETRVLEQRIPIEQAEILAPVLLEPQLEEERAEWLDLAARTSARRLRSYVSRRLEQVRQGRDDLQALTVWTTRRAKLDWRRACDVVSMRKRRHVSEGEAFAYVVDRFLDAEDPLRRARRLEARNSTSPGPRRRAAETTRGGPVGAAPAGPAMADGPAHGTASRMPRPRDLPAGDPPTPDEVHSGRPSGGHDVGVEPLVTARPRTVTGDLFAGRLAEDAGADGTQARGDPPRPDADAPEEPARDGESPLRGDPPIPLGSPQAFLGPAARRPRRVRSSDDAAKRRYVPAGVRRRIWLRAGGVCEIHGCDCSRDLQLCHIRAWARGGANGPWNLLLLCRRHHLLLDAGRIRFLRWSDDGRPAFRLPDGRILQPDARAPPEGGP